MPKVELVILNYNGLKHLEHLLPSALAEVQRYPGQCRVVVVDNLSTQQDKEWVLQNFLDVYYLRWPRFLDHCPVKISDGCRGLVCCYRGRAFRSISFWDWSPIFVSVAQGPAGLGA